VDEEPAEDSGGPKKVGGHPRQPAASRGGPGLPRADSGEGTQRSAAGAYALRLELDFFDIVGAKNARVRFIIVNHAGHLPYQEQPQQFNADLIQFITFWNSTSSTSLRTER
jgi:hypothetical protein